MAMLSAGCQQQATRAVLTRRVVTPFAGLEPIRFVEEVQARWAPPDRWVALPPHKSMLYTHRQWKSQNSTTGVGVVYVRLPLPLGAKIVASLAKDHYAKRSKDGKILSQWTDAAGREWFDCQNARYRVRGYVVTRGLEAWFIYAGYRHTSNPKPEELELAYRSMETITPRPLVSSDTVQWAAAGNRN
jgi:hypothetical protein